MSTESKRIRRRTPFRCSTDRVSIYCKMRKAGFDQETANLIATRFSQGCWSIRDGAIIGAGDRPVLYFPEKEKVNV